MENINEITNTLEVIKTYVSDQDADINNVELTQSIIMEDIGRIEKQLKAQHTMDVATIILLGTIVILNIIGLFKRNK